MISLYAVTKQTTIRHIEFSFMSTLRRTSKTGGNVGFKNHFNL